MDPFALTRQLYMAAAPRPPVNVVAIAILLALRRHRRGRHGGIRKPGPAGDHADRRRDR